LKDVLKNNFPTIYKELANLKFIYEAFRYSIVIKKLYKSCNSTNSKHIKVILNLVRVEFLPALFFESILGFKLKEMGCEVYVLIDDGILKSHDSVSIESLYSRKDEIFRSKFALNLLKKLRIYLKYSEFLSRKEIEAVGIIAENMIVKNDYSFKGINLKTFIESSLIRFFKSGPLVVENELLYSKYLKIFTENAIISVLTASRVKEKFTPDILITSHGIYTTWGPFYEFFKKNSKKAITYDFAGYHNNTVLFSKTGLVHNRNDDGFFSYFVANNSSDYEKFHSDVENVFRKRKRNLFPDQSMFKLQDGEDERLNLLKNLQNNRKKIFAMFPNVLWDGSLTGIDTIFESPLKWILETIRYFENHDDKVLAIRAHPSENTLMKARKTVREMIEELTHREISSFKNLIFIDSDSKLSSYKIFSFIDAGLVYNGTIGLELIYEDIPVLIAGKAPYSGKGFTFDFKSKSEYFKCFEKLSEISELQKKNKNLFFLFAYQYFELNEIPLSFLSSDKRNTLRVDFPTNTILKDKNLNHIVLTILDQRRYFQEWKDF